MARQNLTRSGDNYQKRAIRVAVIPFVEADVTANAADGSVVFNLPPRTIVNRVTSIVTAASGTVNATIDVTIGATVLVNELPVAIADIGDETLVAAARIATTGGEVIIKSGAVAPATGSLVGELIVEYLELDRKVGEFTRMLTS